MSNTTNIKLSTPSHGANVNTWDADPINNNSGVLDTCFGSVTSKTLSNANVTLSATEAQVSIIRLSGVLSGAVAINVGAIVKSWVIENLTSGPFVVTVTGGSGNVVGLPPGSSTVYWDGTNCSFVNLGQIGAYWDYALAVAPAWLAACTVPPALICDGSTFSSGTYPVLAAILGTTTLPDARGRARYALNGGTGRLTTAGGIDGNTRFAGGGSGAGLSIGTANIPNYNLPFSLTWTLTGDNGFFVTNTSQVVRSDAASPFAISINALVNPNITGSIGGTIGSGGSGVALASVSPGYVGGVTMIWAG